MLVDKKTNTRNNKTNKNTTRSRHTTNKSRPRHNKNAIFGQEHKGGRFDCFWNFQISVFFFVVFKVSSPRLILLEQNQRWLWYQMIRRKQEKAQKLLKTVHKSTRTRGPLWEQLSANNNYTRITRYKVYFNTKTETIQQEKDEYNAHKIWIQQEQTITRYKH